MKYPIGIQHFESLRKDGYAYVDKTQHIYNLVNTGRYYFLSRPRRFGKSLLLSTIRAYFEGKKELFEGLALGTLEEKWEQYPILYHVEVERHTSDGRMDILMQTTDYIYILELKVDKTAAIALQQIEDKGYALPFANDPRKLYKIGVNFSNETHKIDDWKVVAM